MTNNSNKKVILSGEELKKVQNVELYLLKEFIKICDENDLKYLIAYGTLIGVVRHKGFIPWDDDIDILMPRNDYDKFNRIASKMLPKSVFLQNYETDVNYPGGFTKLRKTESTFIEINYSKIKMNHGIYIDIFPLDYISNNSFDIKKVKFLKKIFLLRSRAEIQVIEEESHHSKAINRILSIFSNFLALIFPCFSTFNYNIDKILRKSEKSENMINFYAFGYDDKIIYKSKWFDNIKKAEFEGIKVNIPEDYDEILEYIYGDYMKLPPVNQRKSRHFVTNIDTDVCYLKK